jgi:hypothetical protein
MSRSNALRYIRASSLLVVVTMAAAGCGDSPTEPTPVDVSWFSSARQFSGGTGVRLGFNCPASGTPQKVWGADTYTDDSSICTAAVHAGRITLAAGGQVTIEIRPGLSSYGGSSRNGITSLDYDEWDRSFMVR